LSLSKLFQYILSKYKNAVSPSTAQVRASSPILAIANGFLTGTRAVVASDTTHWGFTIGDITQLL